MGKCPQFNTAKIRNELGFQFHDVEVGCLMVVWNKEIC